MNITSAYPKTENLGVAKKNLYILIRLNQRPMFGRHGGALLPEVQRQGQEEETVGHSQEEECGGGWGAGGGAIHEQED